jgi:hypothetical protein
VKVVVAVTRVWFVAHRLVFDKAIIVGCQGSLLRGPTLSRRKRCVPRKRFVPRRATRLFFMRIPPTSEKNLCEWFKKEYKPALQYTQIRSGKYIYNMDEKGARLACPTGEDIVVPIR